MAAAALELQDVTKRFGDARAVGPVSLRLPAGRTTVLLGPSGCGKSTLLRLLAGLLAPSEGRVLRDAVPVSPSPEAFRRQGFVVQGGGLFPHLSAEGNVTLAARFLRWPPERIAARVAELARLARLPPELLARFPAELSGGQRQRVSLMRALMLDPEVLLLDEPLGALDPITRHDLQEDLRAAFDAFGRTVVLVTHDLAEAAFFAHRVVLMREGRVVQEGPIRELLDAPADPFVTRFVNAQRRPLEPREPPP